MHCILRHLYFLALSNCIWSNARNAGNNDCVEESTQKPAQTPEFHPQAEATPGYLGEGGVLRGFPALNLSLPPAAKVKFQPTRPLSGPGGSSQPNGHL